MYKEHFRCSLKMDFSKLYENELTDSTDLIDIGNEWSNCNI